VKQDVCRAATLLLGAFVVAGAMGAGVEPRTPQTQPTTAPAAGQPTAATELLARRDFAVLERGRRIGHAELRVERFTASGVTRTSFEQWVYPDPSGEGGYHQSFRAEYMERGPMPVAYYGFGHRDGKRMSFRLRFGGRRGTLERNLFGEIVEQAHRIRVPEDVRLIQSLYHRALSLWGKPGQSLPWKEFDWEAKEPTFRTVTYVSEGEDDVDVDDGKVKAVRLRVETEGRPESARFLWLDPTGLPVRRHVPHRELNVIQCSEETAGDRAREMTYAEAIQLGWLTAPESASPTTVPATQPARPTTQPGDP
jgi:hypothetical protein